MSGKHLRALARLLPGGAHARGIEARLGERLPAETGTP
jgi:hypothetical protein